MKIRRRAAGGEPGFLEVRAGDALRPSDLLLVEGNAQCVVYLKSGPALPIAVAHVQSVLVAPTRPRWISSEEGGPKPQDFRWLTFQSPPAIEIRNHTIDGRLIYEVFVENGLAQIVG